MNKFVLLNRLFSNAFNLPPALTFAMFSKSNPAKFIDVNIWNDIMFVELFELIIRKKSIF